MSARSTCRTIAATVVLLATGASACNAILGNEPRILEVADASQTDQVTPDSGADAGECSADLSRDPANCGACGHDCLGGACQDGACQPFELASGLPQPSWLLEQDGVLYWVNGDGTVRACPARGCDGTPRVVMKIVAQNPALSGLDVRSGIAYVAGYYTQAIHTCPVTGCGSPTTLVANLQYPVSVRRDGTHVFWIDAYRAAVSRCALPSCSGGAVTIATGSPAWTALAMDEQTLYWLGAGNPPDYSRALLMRAPKDQTDAGPEVLADNLPRPYRMVVRGPTLYMTLAGAPPPDGGLPTDGRVVKRALSSGLELPLATGQAQPAGIALDATDVYWATWGDGAIRRCAIAGCSGAPTTLATGQNQPMGPVVTDAAIYWTEYLGGTVKGLAK